MKLLSDTRVCVTAAWQSIKYHSRKSAGTSNALQPSSAAALRWPFGSVPCLTLTLLQSGGQGADSSEPDSLPGVRRAAKPKLYTPDCWPPIPTARGFLCVSHCGAPRLNCIDEH